MESAKVPTSMRLQRVLPLFLAATLVGFVASASGATGFGGLRGRLTGLPPHALFPAVHAINTRGVISAIAQPRLSGAFRFAVPAGAYVVTATAVNATGRGFAGVSAPVLVRAGRRVRVITRLVPVRRPRRARVFPLANGAIVTFGSVLVVDRDLGSALGGADMRATVINHFFNICSPQGTVLVETDPSVVKYLEQERRLWLAGQLTTPYDYRPLKPQFKITGEADVTRAATGAPHNVDLTVTLTATDLRNGKVVARGTSGIGGGAVEITSTELLASIHQAVARLGANACGSNPVP
jgi:hypothetical protein